MESAEPSALRQAIERYLAYLQSEENKSPLTVESYSRSLKFTEDLLGIDDPVDIDKTVVRQFKKRLHTYRTKQERELAVSAGKIIDGKTAISDQLR